MNNTAQTFLINIGIYIYILINNNFSKSMSKKVFSAAEVLSLLEAEGELDDRDEVFAEGSDEDFDELEELEDDSGSKIETREEVNGNKLKNTSYIYIFLNNLMYYSGCDTSIDMNDCDETLPTVDPIFCC